MRPKPSLAAKSGVGELAARESEAPNASTRERERGELQPPIWPAGLRFCGPYCFSARRSFCNSHATHLSASAKFHLELSRFQAKYGSGIRGVMPIALCFCMNVKNASLQKGTERTEAFGGRSVTSVSSCSMDGSLGFWQTHRVVGRM